MLRVRRHIRSKSLFLLLRKQVKNPSAGRSVALHGIAAELFLYHPLDSFFS